MEQVMLIQTNYSLVLQLFATLVIFNNVQNPLVLWEMFESEFITDVQYRYPSLRSETTARTHLLYELQTEFSVHDRTLQQYRLPAPPSNYHAHPPPRRHRATSLPTVEPMPEAQPPPPTNTVLGQHFEDLPSELQTSVLQYDTHELHDISDRMLDSMRVNNPAQYETYNTILEDVLTCALRATPNRVCAHFIDAPAGTGKTFLLQTLIAHLRSMHHLVLPTATSGIAATNFTDGRTSHGRFKIPIPINETSTLQIPAQSKLANALNCTSCIIWDETANSDNLNVLAVDRSLRILTHCDLFMGGIPFIAASDPRQILPVIPHGSRATIVHHSIYNNDAIWPQFQKHRLSKNMRAHTQGGLRAREFADWLLTVGEGTHLPPEDGITPAVPPDSIQLPPEICINNTRDLDDPLTELPANASKDGLLDFVYGTMQHDRHDTYYFSERLIVAPLLEAVAEINDLMRQRMVLDGSLPRTFLSADSVRDTINQARFPQEFLNSLNNITGMPPHELKLVLGMPVLLLINLRPPKHCNGTRYTVIRMSNDSLTLRAITGMAKGEELHLPRIDMSPGASATKWPFTLQRRQFPIVPAFAISINKSLGQTVNKLGVYLPTSVFSHGQLYVALSRTGNPDNIRILVPDTPRYRTVQGERAFITTNIVYWEVLKCALAHESTSPPDTGNNSSATTFARATATHLQPEAFPPDVEPYEHDFLSDDEFANASTADTPAEAVTTPTTSTPHAAATNNTSRTATPARQPLQNRQLTSCANVSITSPDFHDVTHHSDSSDENMEDADAGDSALAFTDMNVLAPFTDMQTIADGSNTGTVPAVSATLAFQPQGLANWSQNCYANSILQCLRALYAKHHIHIQPILTPALYTVQHQEMGSSNFIIQLSRLLLQQVDSTKAMYNAGTHSADAILQEGLAGAWAEYQNVHQDAMDFLRILQKLTKATIEYGQFFATSSDLKAAWSQVKQQLYDPVFEAMQGEYANCCKCTVCHTKQSHPHSIDTGITLYVPAQPTISLTELLCRDKQQTMNELKPLHCATCQQQINHTITPFSTWKQVPHILNIQLQRHATQISANGFNTSIVSATNITYPNLLTMDEYFNTPARYELVAVIAKIGRYSHAGHYVGYIRDGTSFIQCDDKVIQETTIPPANEAYILIYHLLPTSTRS
jgi:ubiquitin C-terminal hydrolase